MNMKEYMTMLSNNNISSLTGDMKYNNDYTNFGGVDSQELSYFFKLISEVNETVHNASNNSNLLSLSSMTPATFISPEKPFFSSASNTKFYRIFAMLSIWFVLIINPIVILFGVIGNLLATYILIHCNIAKLPVSFYAVMLNISDTLNLLIPVFIFWLDNCINRTPDRGYFRDRSDSLCKALMCLDQLFATLSAWYMCAISFNRWYSVCRPSSYFFHTTTTNISGLTGSTTINNAINSSRTQKKQSSGSITGQSSSCLILFCFPINMCSCLTRNIKFRQHLQAFRSIACMTLIGVFLCLSPIFMHELRSFTATRLYISASKTKISNTPTITWQRCYYNQKHEHAYDIIGIILSCFLHILPLTFVAAMNIMIIIRLKQRQYRMTVASNFLQTQSLGKRLKTVNHLQKKNSNPFNALSRKRDQYSKSNGTRLQTALSINRKDQATSTDVSIQTPHLSNRTSVRSSNTRAPRRHHSRDRTITIMLVSIALSYLILTLPYRFFWSYNVYIKRAHPEKFNSYIYLLKMHFIDHVLRTIRNIHYGTNFVFFILLSKTFRRKFRQIFIERFFEATSHVCHRDSTKIHTNCMASTKSARQRQINYKLGRKENTTTIYDDHPIEMESFSRSIFDETPSLYCDGRMQEGESVSIVGLQQNNLPQYDDE